MKIFRTYKDMHLSAQSRYNTYDSKEIEVDLDKWTGYIEKFESWDGDIGNGIPGYRRRKKEEIVLPDEFIILHTTKDNVTDGESAILYRKGKEPIILYEYSRRLDFNEYKYDYYSEIWLGEGEIDNIVTLKEKEKEERLIEIAESI